MDRTIPACAGEPTGTMPNARTSMDYPRVCGGTPAIWCGVEQPYGLSPRVRGNRSRAGPRYCLLRTIPACAGEPHYDKGDVNHRLDYPRVCGGTVKGFAATILPIGLSPRVRGNLAGPPVSQDAGRTIPACAGEPATFSLYIRQYPDYPRVCGGTYGGWRFNHDASGLSPRVRGNRQPFGPGQSGHWTIPACAGEPIPAHRQRDRCSDYPRVCGGTWQRKTRPP